MIFYRFSLVCKYNKNNTCLKNNFKGYSSCCFQFTMCNYKAFVVIFFLSLQKTSSVPLRILRLVLSKNINFEIPVQPYFFRLFWDQGWYSIFNQVSGLKKSNTTFNFFKYACFYNSYLLIYATAIADLRVSINLRISTIFQLFKKLKHICWTLLKIIPILWSWVKKEKRMKDGRCIY